MPRAGHSLKEAGRSRTAVAPTSSAGDAVMERLKGDMAIGHTRYATTGETILRNVQPLFAQLDSGGFSIAHNGTGARM